MPDWRAALAEVHRVLKPGGRFFAEEVLAALIVNRFFRLLVDHPQEDRFDGDGFVSGLEQAGFRVLGRRDLWGWFVWCVGERI